jgi:hypothetical protein
MMSEVIWGTLGCVAVVGLWKAAAALFEIRRLLSTLIELIEEDRRVHR